MPTKTTVRSLDDLIVSPACEADRHDGARPCVCPTRRQKERDGKGNGRIPKTDPKHEARFTAMPDADREASRLELALRDRDDLACQDEDPELFFPISGMEGPAKAVCRRCPAVDDCLTFALATGDDFAVMGATSADDRRRMRKVMNGWAA